MKWTVLALGAAIGFSVACAASCGSSSCGPDNCAGCCTPLGLCVDTPANGTPETCGAAGRSCAGCASGQTCGPAFTCVPINAGGDGGPTDCASGCRASIGCVLPANQTPQSCGTGNESCHACATGYDCVSGVCTPPAVIELGAACSSSLDCAGLPIAAHEINPFGLMPGDSDYDAYTWTPTPMCKRESNGTSSVVSTYRVETFTYPDGYCTKRCTDHETCGEGNICGYFLGFIGEFDSICLARCDPAASSCRNGYSCTVVGTDDTGKDVGACLPGAPFGQPLPAWKTGVDAGRPGTVQAGRACTSNADCADGGPESSRCLGNWPDGYCVADCTASNDETFCGPDSACVWQFIGEADPSTSVGPLFAGVCLASCGVSLPVDGGADAGWLDAGMDPDGGVAGDSGVDDGGYADAGHGDDAGSDGGASLPSCRSGYTCAQLTSGDGVCFTR